MNSLCAIRKTVIRSVLVAIGAALVVHGSAWAERVESKADLETFGPVSDLTEPGGDITGTQNGSYSVLRVFDNVVNTWTSWWLTDKGTDNRVIYRFPAATVVNAFMMRISGDASYSPTDRAPKKFHVLGSNDYTGDNYSTATWVALDTESGQTGWNKNESRYFRFVNGTAYQSYCIRIETTCNGAAWAQLDEMELYRSITGGVMVMGSPENLGTPNPDYGLKSDIAYGETVTFRAPSVYTNAAGTVGSTCTGWKLYDHLDTLLDEGAGTEFEFTYPQEDTYRKLVWQWKADYKVEATAGEHGSVATTSAWVPAGCSTLVTATATADAGYGFYRWTGGFTGGNAYRPTITAQVMAGGTLQAEFLPQQTVEPTDDKAHLAIQAALDVAPAGGIVRLKEGKYRIDIPVKLTNNVHLIGAGVDKTFVYGSSICTNRGFTITHANAELADLTVSNMYSSVATSSGGAGAYMSNGTVRDCKITRCRAKGFAGSSKPGVGIYMTGGLLTGTEITDCQGSAYNGIGFAVWASGGTVTNCDIHANNNGYSHSNLGGGGATVYLQGTALVTHSKIHHNTGHNNPGIYQTNGKVFNTLVYNNRYTGSAHAGGLYKTAGKTYGCTFWGNGKGSDQTGASGLWQTGGDTRDCIFYANSPTEGESGQYGSVYVTGGTFATNVNDIAVAYASQVGTISGDPKFKDAAAADFRLLDRSSSAYGRAAKLDDLPTDFAGRVRGDKPSIGAYEYDASGEKLDLLLSLTKTDYAPGETVEIEAMLTGTDEEPDIAWTVDGAATAYTGYKVTITGLTGGRHTIAASTKVGTTPLAKSVRVTFLVPEVYVNATGSGEFPYDTALKATNDVSEALTALYRGANVVNRLHVGTGTFRLSDTIPLNLPFRIEGEGADRSILYATSRTFTAVNLSHASAYVADVALSNFNRGVSMSAGNVTRCRMIKCGSPTKGGGANVSGGLLTDSVFDRCSVGDYYSLGGGVYVSGSGVVSNVLISGCIQSGSTSGNNDVGGGGACVDGGTLTHARIVGSNGGAGWADYYAGLVVLKGVIRNSLISDSRPYKDSAKATVLQKGGTIENCTFVDNGTNKTDCVAVKVTGGTFVNNIVWRNGEGGDVKATGGTLSHNCYSEAEEGANGNTARDPRLRTNREGQMALRDGSSAIDKATPRDWMTSGATDLYGNPRVLRGVPDMGCSEWQPTGLSVIVR